MSLPCLTQADYQMIADILTDTQIDLAKQGNACRFSQARAELMDAADSIAELRRRLENTALVTA